MPPVIWKPTTKFGYPRGALGRNGQPVRAHVRHRIVGSLASADAVFAPASASMASTHFGIGHLNGRLEIHQYVDLTDAAWGNGDVNSPTSKIVLANPGVNPNAYTVSYEHEDGGSAGGGIVQPDTWAASVALGVLLASGNAVAIRQAGIHMRADTTATQMAAVPKTIDGYIDHNQIAGPNKPYCFRRWLQDPGFVEGSPSRRDQLLAALNGKDMIPMILRPVKEDFTTGIGSPGGVFYTAGPGLGDAKTFTTHDRVTSIAESSDGLWRVLLYGIEILWMERAKLTPIAGTRAPATGYGLTFGGAGFTQAQVDAAISTAAAAAKAAGIVQGVTSERGRLRTFLGL